jgi:glycosyltransferase involved in cell wall biosynthesis
VTAVAVAAGGAVATTAVPRPQVCLLCEGTYPYIAGGVSSWVHDIIRGEPQVTFSVLNLGSYPGWHGESRFQLPANVARLDDLYCQMSPPKPVADAAARAALDRDIRRFRRRARRRSLSSRVLGALRRLHFDSTVDDQLLADFATGDLTEADLLYSAEGFALIEEMAERLAPGTSFNDFFWQCRAMNCPIIRLVRGDVPAAGAYHSLSAGYAGFLGAVLSNRTGCPFLLTEHGLYSRERDIELARADWIPDRAVVDPLVARIPVFSPLRRIWSRYFRRLSEIAYHQALHIVTLSEANRRKQIVDGAEEAKTLVIPNGVEPVKPAAADASGAADGRPGDDAPLRVGFVGRLVPIKDLLMFIRACDLALREVPLDVRIIGPGDEDPGYAKRCYDLVETLNRGAAIRFLGMQPMGKIYTQIDVLVLTSFSEGQPLVILEAYANGVPAVCTDVGCCREMIEGQPGADRALGPSGIVTRVAVPQDTSQAIVKLARDRDFLRRCGQAALQRLTARYQRSTMLASYRDLYAEVI